MLELVFVADAVTGVPLETGLDGATVVNEVIVEMGRCVIFKVGGDATVTLAVSAVYVEVPIIVHVCPRLKRQLVTIAGCSG